MPRIGKLLLCLTAVVVLSGSVLHGTAQRTDTLRLNDKEVDIQTNPLEPFFRAHPSRKPESTVFSTSLWRGYIATWEIADRQLFLTDVQILAPVEGADGLATDLESVMDKVFPGQDRVLADWFSGHIVVIHGDRVQYRHMGYGSLYDGYVLITVIGGRVTAETHQTLKEHREFRKAQFAAYKRTAEYELELQEILAENNISKAEAVAFLRDYSSERYMSMIFADTDRTQRR